MMYNLIHIPSGNRVFFDYKYPPSNTRASLEEALYRAIGFKIGDNFVYLYDYWSGIGLNVDQYRHEFEVIETLDGV